MNIKETIKNTIMSGAKFAHSFKESQGSWVGEAYITIVCTDMLEPQVLVSYPMGKMHKAFPLEEIDEAIDNYCSVVFSKKNLWWKMQEVQLELKAEGVEWYFDEEEDLKMVYDRVRKKQDEHIKNS